MMLGQLDIFMQKKKKNDLDYFMPDIKINSKLITNENATANM